MAPPSSSSNGHNIFVSPFDTNFEEFFVEEDVLDLRDGDIKPGEGDGVGEEEGFYSEDSDGDLDDELRREFVDEENVGGEGPRKISSASTAAAAVTDTQMKNFKKYGKLR